MTKHTPTPWETSSCHVNNRTIWDVYAQGAGDMLADLKDCDNAEANAAFIVRAANNYQALIEALETLLSAMLRSQDRPPPLSIGQWHAARAALRQAKGD